MRIFSRSFAAGYVLVASLLLPLSVSAWSVLVCNDSDERVRANVYPTAATHQTGIIEPNSHHEFVLGGLLTSGVNIAVLKEDNLELQIPNPIVEFLPRHCWDQPDNPPASPSTVGNPPPPQFPGLLGGLVNVQGRCGFGRGINSIIRIKQTGNIYTTQCFLWGAGKAGPVCRYPESRWQNKCS